MPSGVVFAALAYAMWGLFPLYFKQLAQVGAFEVVLHRSVWTLACMLLVLAVLRRWAWMREVARRPRELALSLLSALVLSVNWLVYIWAVNHDRVVDASLGYFITPLVNVLLGFFVLHERPRRAQWVAIGLASAGVLWMTLAAGQWPWIGLLLAASFGLYGLLRKIAPLGALEGLALETLLVAPLTLPLLWLWSQRPGSAWDVGDPATGALLLLAGPLTALPLLLFAAGARRIQLTTLGLLQYIGPTIQFALGVWLYHEPLHGARLTGFALIWLALAVYSADSWLAMRRAGSAAAAAPTVTPPAAPARPR